MDDHPLKENLEKLEKELLIKQKQLEEELIFSEKSDPVLFDNTPESSEPGTDAWQADVHARSEIVKNILQQQTAKIKKTILKLRTGTYGQCEKCGQQIETERLRILPTATFCLVCLAIRPHL